MTGRDSTFISTVGFLTGDHSQMRSYADDVASRNGARITPGARHYPLIRFDRGRHDASGTVSGAGAVVLRHRSSTSGPSCRGWEELRCRYRFQSFGGLAVANVEAPR